MITQIQLKKVTSYGSNLATLETDKAINLIYGLNGSGKTTLSNFLSNTSAVDFSECNVTGLSDEKILVYNQNFVDKNFHEQDHLSGIFTLSEGNAEAKAKIESAQTQIKKIDKLLKDEQGQSGFLFEREKIENRLKETQNSAKTKIWEIKDNYHGGDRILEFCLDGFNKSDKLSFFKQFLEVVKDQEKPAKSLEILKKEALETQGENAKTYNVSDISKIDFDSQAVEANSIFSEVIVGNENLAISSLIQELRNSDWVKVGLSYLPGEINSKEACPFCQENTISSELHHQIKSYFDAVYENKIHEIKNLENDYSDIFELVPSLQKIFENPFFKEKKQEVELLHKNLVTKLSRNLSLIKEKRLSPSKTFTLDETHIEIQAFNNLIEKVHVEINEHNQKIQNREATKDAIKKDFWVNLRWEYDQTVDWYLSETAKTDTDLQVVNEKIKTLEDEKEAQKGKIKEAQKEQVNIDEAVNNINTQLDRMAVEDFEIQKIDEFSYQIRRIGKESNQFKTLSEGEKTIISFLYFLELCKGKENRDEVSSKKIVVIDDPISSLSHMYIFNIAQLIKRYFWKQEDGFNQVFVLTHSLYFFHELMGRRLKKKTTKIFRVQKKQSGSEISEMQEDEIQNDYQAYWTILREHDESASNALLANSMRNILEHFFGFIEVEDFDKILITLDETEYNSFIRYVHRESHSDLTNLSDMKEIDPDIFKSAFKKVFEDAGYPDHYKKMMQV